MILADVLRLAELSYNTYKIANRRQHFSFMTRDVNEAEPSERFDYRHALALATFVELRRLGVSVEGSIEAINDSWRHIAAVVSGDAVDRPLCGIRQNQLGVFETLGRPRNDTDPDRCISGSWVSLPEVFVTVKRVEADLASAAPGSRLELPL